jgi:hypothetical protein
LNWKEFDWLPDRQKKEIGEKRKDLHTESAVKTE